MKKSLDVHPLEAGRWEDFEAVMGPNGGARGCWCMHWRLSMDDWFKTKGDGNRELMRGLASSKAPPGLIAYVDGEPAGWCSIGERKGYSRLDRSAILKPVDDRPVWSVACLFFKRPFRQKGLQLPLLEAATDFARRSGARIVEGYPVEPKPGKKASSDNAMTGMASVFLKAGFVEVARHKSDRPIMRKEF